jgi:hypothetical protein
VLVDLQFARCETRAKRRRLGGVERRVTEALLQIVGNFGEFGELFKWFGVVFKYVCVCIVCACMCIYMVTMIHDLPLRDAPTNATSKFNNRFNKQQILLFFLLPPLFQNIHI